MNIRHRRVKKVETGNRVFLTDKKIILSVKEREMNVARLRLGRDKAIVFFS